MFWLLTSNTYPDYDGYTVYTSRVAASEPRPAWPSLTPELFESVRPSVVGCGTMLRSVNT